MKLYTGRITPNGKRVRICAAEAGVPMDVVPLDFQKGDARSPEYLALNPMGKVPTVADGDFVLWESAAILTYVARRGDGTLFPKEPHAEADTLRWMFFGACHLDPYVTTLVVERFIKARQGHAPDAALTADAERWLARFIPVVDGQLATREFVTGSFSVADIALGCTLELSPLLNLDLAPYANVRRWLERLQARPSWRAAATD